MATSSFSARNAPGCSSPSWGGELEGKPAERAVELASPSGATSSGSLWQKVKLTTAHPAGYVYPTRDTRKDGQIAATISSFGKGMVGPVASIYFRSHHPWFREFIGELTAMLFPDPAVRVEGPYCLDVSLRTTRDGKLTVPLLNTAGMPLPARYGFTDFLPPFEKIRLTVKTPALPKSVTWVPNHGTLDWSWSNGLLNVTVPKLKIHGVVVIDISRLAILWFSMQIATYGYGMKRVIKVLPIENHQ